MLPPPVVDVITTLIGKKNFRLQVISTGKNHNTLSLIFHPGERYFLKWNKMPESTEILNKEALGLDLLANSGAVNTPKIIGKAETTEGSILILEFITESKTNSVFWNTFGKNIASLHRISNEYFGLPFNNFIGNLPQQNNQENNWLDFFILHRLEPQFERGLSAGLLGTHLIAPLHRLYHKLDQLIPEESPALLHGDLWNGNFISSKNGIPMLIDPAPYYGHREMDLAMTRLFGGFSPEFYYSYEESFPLTPDFEERAQLFQLYYLLVHVNLFSGIYISLVEKIIRKFSG